MRQLGQGYWLNIHNLRECGTQLRFVPTRQAVQVTRPPSFLLWNTGGVERRPGAVSVAGLGDGSLPRRKASSEIISALRRRIAAGELPRGARLPTESDLAAHFGVSQPTVREGLRVLEAMGLIEVRHGSGAYVTGDAANLITDSIHTLLQIDRVGVLEVVEMRTALADYSIRRAVRCATDEEIDIIQEQGRRLDDVARSSDFRHITEAAIAFQVSVSAASHNALQLAIESALIMLLVRLQIEAFSQRSSRFWRKWSLQFAEERQDLVERLRARDEEGAVAAMQTYLGTQRQRFTADSALAKARVSDPDVLRVFAPLEL